MGIQENDDLETQADLSEEETLCAGGFQFLSKEDAEKARIDERKLEYLDNHVNCNSLSGVQAVYEKAIENRVFKSPIGWVYLQNLRKQMIELGAEPDSIRPIPVLVAFSHVPQQDDYFPKQRIQRLPEKKKFPVLLFSLVCNVVLVALVIAMFFIADTGEADNIVNYKRNITNRYASWDQEITQRENVVREKERELGLSNIKATNDAKQMNSSMGDSE